MVNVNINGKSAIKIKQIICTDKQAEHFKKHNKIIFVKTNNDKSLDVKMGDKMYYFKTYNEFKNNLKSVLDKSIILSVEDINFCE